MTRPKTEFDPAKAMAFFDTLDDRAKVSFWSVLGHGLTIIVRGVLSEDKIGERELDQVKRINEMLHHLTSCINPAKRRSKDPWNDAELLGAMLDSASRIGLRDHFLDAWERAEGSVR